MRNLSCHRSQPLLFTATATTAVFRRTGSVSLRALFKRIEAEGSGIFEDFVSV